MTALWCMNMKKISYLFFTGAILLMFAGCKKEPEPIVYTTLAQLASETVSSSTDFDIHIKNLVVSGIFNSYVQFEDGTAGAQFNKSGHTFKVGQTFEGHITGKYRVSSSGVLTFSEIAVTDATLTQATEIPCQTVTIAEIASGKSQYYHRRIKLQNITFVNGFKGSAGGSGIISQKGVQISATCRPEGFKVEDGSQGDIICFPSPGACFVFDSKDFEEHEITTPLTEKTDFGLYTVTETSADDLFKYTPGADQYGYSFVEKNVDFRYQNFLNEWVVAFNYPSKVKAGQVFDLNVDVAGNVPDVTSGKVSVVVEKVGTDKLWLMNYVTGTGYVVYYEKEEK